MRLRGASRLQPIEWRVTFAVAQEFNRLLREISQASDGSDEQLALFDEVRSLAGYPYEADPDTTIIHTVLV